MDKIYSKDNSIIKHTRKLSQKKYRIQKNQFLVEGFRFVSEALKSDFQVPVILLSERVQNKWLTLESRYNICEDTKICLLEDKLFNYISNTDNPQGIAAVVNNKKINVKNEDGFYILVDKVQDPGNMGTIIRTADAAGALGILLTKGTVDVYNEKTLRSTMGSIFHIPVIQDDSLEKLNLLKKHGFKLIASSLDTDKNFYDLDLNKKVIIALGNEGNGISSQILDLSDIKIKIPMPGNAESLNVSIAGAVIMFEVVRQINTEV
ncbi:RNA methyltransferase [Clostridium fermenticellae]|uniref:RNA methyltransferase n=1 Tax=Clostridium fermenticellae TaxID=2068654 RepID=A0A386H261_9CLOT|nr:RNA methyltransferase [Clostridium fermenticellae]AYD39779.1 RNA methyltransferase [Clostridium fermenticellae]